MSYEINQIVNVIKNDFIRYRGLTINNLDDITEEQVSRGIETVGYIKIYATRNSPRGKRQNTIILILDETSKYSHNSPELKKIMNSIDLEESYKNKTLDELILIVGNSVENKKNLIEVIKNYQQRETKGPDYKGIGPFYTVIYFRNMKSCIPEYVGVPKHILMNPQESIEFLDYQLKTISDLPKILHIDPQILWIGGRQGQLIKIIRDSDTTGESEEVRAII